MSQTIHIQKRAYAACLEWRLLDEDGSKSEVINLAQELSDERVSHAVLLRPDRSQDPVAVGFATTRVAKKSPVSIAALALNALWRPGVAICMALQTDNDTIWGCVISTNGIVLPSTDAVFTSEEEFQRAVSTWRTLISSATSVQWVGKASSFCDTDSDKDHIAIESLDDISWASRTHRAKAHLKPLSGQPMRWALVAGVLAMGGFAAWSTFAPDDRGALLAASKAEAERKTALAREAVEQQRLALLSLPDPSWLATVQQRALTQIPVSALSWQFKDITCTTALKHNPLFSDCLAEWTSPGDASLQTLKTAAPINYGFQINGNKASSSIVFPRPTLGLRTPALSTDTLVEGCTRLRSIGIQCQITAPSVIPRLPGMEVLKPADLFKTGTWSVAGDSLNRLDAFSAIGFGADVVSVDSVLIKRSGEWSARGRYVFG